MSPSLKYAVVERERRYLVGGLPDGVEETWEILDRYIIGTKMRLREVRKPDGTITHKLGHKVRLGDGTREVACTNFYLDEAEWALVGQLPSRTLHKRRHIIRRDGFRVAIDEHADGTLVAEIDDGERPSDLIPTWLTVIEDVTDDEQWTGSRLAR